MLADLNAMAQNRAYADRRILAYATVPARRGSRGETGEVRQDRIMIERRVGVQDAESTNGRA